MGSYGEYLMDRPVGTPVSYNPQNIPGTNWQQVQNEIAALLPQVTPRTDKPVDVKVPTLTELSGGMVVGQGTYGGTYGIVPAASAPPISVDRQFTTYEEPSMPVKTPERDVVSLVSNPVDAETIQNLLFENIGANELTRFVRHDTVEGINPYYDIISNLSDIKRQFDPSNIISLQKTNSSFFDIYPIKLEYKIPDEKYLLENNLTDYVYIDTNGDLVIELTNMQDFEVVEVQIDTNGTIYEVDEL